MPNKIDDRLQGSKYDKILRENMPFILPGIMKNVFKLNLVKNVPLKDKIQITKQKEVDALSIVTDREGGSYTLINFLELPHELFLSSNEPEEQILAILANLGDKAPTEVIKAVLEKIAKNTHEGLTNNKYYEQLRVIVQLRNFDKQIDTAMLEVNTFWKKERDTLYKWGKEDGIEKGRHEEALEIARELKKEDLAIEFIAKTTKLSIEEIQAL